MLGHPSGKVTFIKSRPSHPHKERPVEDWPDRGYLSDNVDGRLPDPDDELEATFCLGHGDSLVYNLRHQL